MGRDERHLRVASYNVRKCIGTDRRRDPSRVLDVISGLAADVVALQEADKRLGTRPSAFAREALGEAGWTPLPIAISEVSLGWHGNAMLLGPRVGVDRIDRLDLPGFEPRGAIVAELRHGPRAFRLVAAHLGLRRRDRRRQLDALAERLADAHTVPTVLIGDFNEWRDPGVFGLLGQGFETHSPGPSYPTRFPLLPLDRIVAGPGVAVRGHGVAQTPASRVASDHLPIWADLDFHPHAGG